ncbi:MAG: hypothetical protein ACLRIS_07880 [Flavonifractor plautii]
MEQAAATGWGEAVRHSETLGTSMFYVSKRFADGMVGRASMPLSSIDSLVWNGVWGFLIASAAGLLLALILARRTANRVMAPLSAVGSALQSVLDGTRASGLEDYQADDELRPILRYIDKLMERLGGYIQSITAERDKVGLILDCMDEGLILLDEAGNVLAINQRPAPCSASPMGRRTTAPCSSPAAAACGRPFRSPASATPPWCWTWMPSPRTPRACACLSPRLRPPV